MMVRSAESMNLGDGANSAMATRGGRASRRFRQQA
jgi:hypothetical protein